MSAVLLIPAIAVAPLAAARPAQPVHAAKKKHKKLNCKLKKNKHKKQCKKHKPVGLGPVTGSTIGAPINAIVSQRSFDSVPTLAVGGTAASAPGQLSAIKYYANFAKPVRFVLLSSAAVVKQIADTTPTTLGPTIYTLPTPWNVAAGDRLGVWQSASPAIGFGQTSGVSGIGGKVPSGEGLLPALVGPLAAAPAVGSTVPVRQSLNLVYSFGGTLGPPVKGPPTLTLPAPITVPATAGKKTAAVTFVATATDYLGATVPVSCKPAAPGGLAFAYNVGTTTVTCAAKDSYGQTSTGSFTVTVTL